MAQSVSDWSSLIGQTVELRRQGQVVRQGKVDMVSDDSSMLWLEPDATHGRQLFLRADGYVITTFGCHD
ncbi:hypothetical protein FDW83_17570 [Pseudarthrobacter sp. NamE2]|uniref:hypothetical protein n=1 Tax=Pseudarthrobacter sp. NamE2 TaxID=2576838 RepID=UPI0010FD4829|nr:hypothetical protein [Pseudarthrobacter sp. NamE2]TLM81068.1 hypothetical protein FDW83_17570 [Pseudarthrobacter sp. NamE2]